MCYTSILSDLWTTCQSNVSKTKKLIMDYRKRRAEHITIHIDRAVVEQVESLKFLFVHSTKDLSCSTHQHSYEEGTMPL